MNRSAGALDCDPGLVVQCRVRLDRAPDILVIHAGGNDLGSRSTRDILRDVKLDCL